MNTERYRVLLVDDDEDSYVLTRDLLEEVQTSRFELEWVSTFEDGLRRISESCHDAYLFDYRLGAQTGLDLLREALALGTPTPVILLTSQGDEEIDREAMSLGAADYLVKGQMDAEALGRCIRYAVSRARAQSALRESEQRYRLLVEAQPDAICRWLPDTTLTFVNDGYCRAFGVTRESLIGKKWMDFIPASARAEVESVTQGLVANPEVHRYEHQVFDASGQIGWQEWVDCPIFDSQGVLAEFQSIGRDITGRRRFEEERNKLATAVEQAAEAILITGTDGCIIYVNPAFESVSGYKKEEVIGRMASILKSPGQDPKCFVELWEKIRRGEVWNGRFENLRKDGSTYEVECVIAPVRDHTGQIINYVSTQRDISYERQMEEHIRQAQKMDAIGRLAGGMAHDFNNLLTVIGGFANLLMGGLDRSDPLRANAEEIQKASDRAALINRQLLAFSRKQLLKPKVIDLNTLIAGMEQIIKRAIGEGISLVTQLDGASGRIKADPTQIEQVVLNLAINARDAMPHGGRLLIETRGVQLDHETPVHGGHLAPGHYVVLVVTDRGLGMSADVKAHLFEPFFSTKDPSRGTGLGLATCYGIIKQSGGDIHVYSEVGKGTSVKVYLPRTEAEATTVPGSDRLSALPKGTETILVVEDEPALAELAARILRSSGYQVLKAGNGAEGLRVAMEHGIQKIDLVVSDVVMPEMGGAMMAEHMKQLRADISILFVSGYTYDALQDHGVLDPEIAFLEKPFTPARLAHKVREVLDDAKRRSSAS